MNYLIDDSRLPVLLQASFHVILPVNRLRLLGASIAPDPKRDHTI
jgi:hypothetical protein